MKLALLFGMLFFSAPSHALSGNDLYELFASEDAMDIARGLGYTVSK